MVQFSFKLRSPSKKVADHCTTKRLTDGACKRTDVTYHTQFISCVSVYCIPAINYSTTTSRCSLKLIKATTLKRLRRPYCHMLRNRITRQRLQLSEYTTTCRHFLPTHHRTFIVCPIYYFSFSVQCVDMPMPVTYSEN